MKPRLTLALLALCGVALAALSFLPRRPLLVWNFTASAPVGLYRTVSRPWSKGDWAAVDPEAELRATLAHFGALEGGRLLVKRIAAVQDDEVCRRGQIVTINGVQRAIAREQTSAGDPLPAWSGCRRLRTNEVLLLGQANTSFDGRYFGVTSAADIIAPLAIVATLEP